MTRSLLSALLIVLVCICRSAGAAIDSWTATSGGLWNTTTNWSAAAPPGSADTALFNLASTYSVNFDVSPTITAIDMQNGTVTFNLDGHTLTTTSAGSNIEDAGNGQIARLTVINGSVVSAGNSIGSNAVDTGSLTVSTGASWATPGAGAASFVVGNNGNGTLTVINGGQVSNSGGITYLAEGTTGFGTATVSGTGSLWSITSGSSAYFGYQGNATATVSAGGALSTTVPAVLGNFTTGSGTLTVTGANSTFISSALTLGSAGSGSMTVSGGASATVNGSVFFAAASSSSSGSLTVTGANSTFTSTSGNFLLGDATATANLQVSLGGTLTSQVTSLSAVNGSSSTSILSDSNTTWNAASLAIGGTAGNNGGAATLTIGAGSTINVAALTDLRNSTGTSLTLTGGTLNTGSFNRLGTFNFNDGTLHISGTFTNGSSAGSLVLNGSTTTALPTLRLSFNSTTTNVTNIIVGNTARGALLLDSGRNLNVGANEIDIAVGPLSSGSIGLTDANTTLIDSATLGVGGTSSAAGGAGTLSIANGATLNANILHVWDTDGTALNLSGGLLITNTIVCPNPARFNWTGGNITYNGTFIVDNGGTLGSALAIPANSTLTTPSLVNNGSITLALGSTISGPISNNGSLSGSGTLAGSGGVTNDGAISLTGPMSMTNTGTLTNSGSISIPTGTQLSLPITQFGTATLSNSGTVQLSGGSLSAGALNNNVDGTIQGAGTITAATPLSNAGLLLATGGTLRVSNAFTSTGVIQLSDATANLTGGAITNNGAIQGLGKISSAIANNGSIEALGPAGAGILNLTGTLTNNASGLLTASTGNKLLVAAGLATNAGTINLTGGTFDNNGHVLDNTGQVSGFGTFRTGGLTNDGAITFSGGFSTIDGAATNSALRTLNIKYNPALFTGSVTNNGTLKTTSTTATFAGTFTNNGTFTSDPSINVFQSDFIINSTGVVTGGTGDVFTFQGGNFINHGSYSSTGTLNNSDPTSNDGTFSQAGTQSWATGATFTNTAGSASFGSDTGAPGSFPLTINASGGAVAFSATQHLHALSLANSANVSITPNTSATIVTPSLSFAGSTNAWQGTLDLTNGALIVQSDSLNKGATLTTLQNQAFNQNITSSSVAADPSHKLLAIVDNALFGRTTFNGEPVDANSLLLEATYKGDANLDRKVDVVDLGVLATNYGATTTAGITKGDFNGDGKVDVIDLGILATDYGLGTTGGGFTLQQDLTAFPQLSSQSSSPGTSTSVPEPSSLAILIIAGAAAASSKSI